MDLYAITTQQQLDQISRNCPRALATYTMILAKACYEGKASFTRKQVTHDLSESYVKFRNDVRALARQDLLEWHEMGDTLQVTLALPEENE